jgi:threonine aldolase
MLGIQFEELFRDGKYMEISRHAIAMGDRLIKGLQEKGYEFRYTAETNQLFPILTEEKMQELSGEFAFSHWEDLGGGRHVVRFVTSFMTKEENVDKLIAAL